LAYHVTHSLSREFVIESLHLGQLSVHLQSIALAYKTLPLQSSLFDSSRLIIDADIHLLYFPPLEYLQIPTFQSHIDELLLSYILNATYFLALIVYQSSSRDLEKSSDPEKSSTYYSRELSAFHAPNILISFFGGTILRHPLFLLLYLEVAA